MLRCKEQVLVLCSFDQGLGLTVLGVVVNSVPHSIRGKSNCPSVFWTRTWNINDDTHSEKPQTFWKLLVGWDRVSCSCSFFSWNMNCWIGVDTETQSCWHDSLWHCFQLRIWAFHASLTKQWKCFFPHLPADREDICVWVSGCFIVFRFSLWEYHHSEGFPRLAITDALGHQFIFTESRRSFSQQIYKANESPERNLLRCLQVFIWKQSDNSLQLSSVWPQLILEDRIFTPANYVAVAACVSIVWYLCSCFFILFCVGMHCILEHPALVVEGRKKNLKELSN